MGRLDLQTPDCLVAEARDLGGGGMSVVNVLRRESKFQEGSASVSEMYLSGSVWPFGGLELFSYGLFLFQK